MAETRRKFSTNTPSEKKVGYSRAVESKDEQRLYISGTTSVGEDGKVQGASVYEQTDFIFKKIKSVLREANFVAADIVLIRTYLTDVKKISEFDKAFIEHFSKINPACTLVGVTELVDPALLVEIEFIADKG